MPKHKQRAISMPDFQTTEESPVAVIVKTGLSVCYSSNCYVMLCYVMLSYVMLC